MRIFKFLLLFLLIFSLTSLSVSASGDSFWDEFLETVPEGSDIGDTPEELLAGEGAEGIIRGIVDIFRDRLAASLSFFLMLFGVGLIICLSENIGYEREGRIFSLATSLISTASAVGIFLFLRGSVLSTGESIKEINSFFESLTPIFSGVLLAGGNAKGAVAQTVNMNLCLAVIGGICEKFLLPLSLASFAFSLLSGLGAEEKIQKSIRGVFGFGLGITTSAVAGVTALQSVIATAQDGVTMRAAKYAASGLIPVVGSSVSGALSTLAGGLSYVKGAIGVGSVILFLGFICAPLVTHLVYRIMLSFAVSFMELLGSCGGVRLFSAFKSALDTLIATYAMLSVVYILQIILFIKSGVSVFG